MSEALARREKLEFSESQIELIKKQIMPPVKVKERGEWIEKPATDDELQMFLYVCKEKNLDPLVRQIYAMRNREGRLTFMTSIDGLRIQAERTQVYAGQEGPYWCGEDGAWKDVWLSNEYPVAAKVGVFRHGFKEPVWGTAKFKSYAQWKEEWVNNKPTGKKVLIGFWAKGDEHMLAKVAEAIALRKAFPTQMGESGASALYIAEEAHAIAGEERGSKEAAKAVADEKVRQHEAQKALEAPKPPAAVVPEFQSLPPIEAAVEQGVAVGPDGEFILPDEPEPVATSPLIEAYKEIKGQKFVVVTWNGIEISTFDEKLKPFLKDNVGKPAELTYTTTVKGEKTYTNLEKIITIDGQRFDMEAKKFEIQRGLL